MTKATEDVLAERRRQIEGKGFDEEHDDGYSRNELARAAACYAVSDLLWKHEQITDNGHLSRPVWPWSSTWWKPKSPRQDLVRAAALLIAEIERMDRQKGDE